MDEQTRSVPIEIKAADLAELEEWARRSEQAVHDLLQEALRQFMEYVRAEHAMYEEARQGPSYTLEEVEAYLAELRDGRAEAAE